MHTCLYEGSVWHRRQTPVFHEFRYALSMMYLDLDELDEAFRGRWLWAANRSAVVSFRRSDHLGDPGTPLAESIRQLLTTRGLPDVRGPIRLLTQPRYLGFAMNPVSFFFCYDASGTQIDAVVVEVTNTPWGEQHCYVFPGAAIALSPGLGEQRAKKELHVSPFLPMDLEYRCGASQPGERLTIRVENYRERRPIFEAVLQMTRQPWTTSNLGRNLLRYPLMTQRIAAGIYWQALRIWWRGCPYFPHPGRLPSAAQPQPV